jgi:translation initiation factor IF-2
MKRQSRTNRSNRGSQRPAASSQAAEREKVVANSDQETQVKEIELPASITVRELADLMSRSPIDLIKELMNAGVMANINQQIDYDTAAIIAEDMGYTVVETTMEEPEAEEQEETATPVAAAKKQREYAPEEQKYLKTRPPVVTILGHVDHGKTSLLDVIREASVQTTEAGGITQHIGAYQVDLEGEKITFVDTPGHEAFAAMRARGASVTDIAVLVVAADDGVQPQTREALDHARAAQVPIIVALNKIDLPSANPDHVKQQLSDQGLVPEEWGGEAIVVPVSAKQRLNIDALLENILLVAEIADLKANPRRPAEGTVIEGRMDRARGSTATLLVQEGTLETGAAISVGQTYGKIRAMFDYKGVPITSAGPSTPVVVIGLRDVPGAGDTFRVVENERMARSIAEKRTQESQEQGPRATPAMTLEEVYAQAQAGKVQSLNLILKADVQGSIEPIKSSLERIEVEELSAHFVHEGVGNVGESDVNLAVAANAIIIAFNVGVDPAAERLAESEGVDIRRYNIIYRVIEDVEKALTGMLEPVFEDVLRGKAIVRQVFRISRVGIIAGSQITEGKGLRNATGRIVRNGEVIHQGRISSLKRFTEDVREINTGLECGIGVDGASDVQEGDIIEFYTREQVR